MSCNRIKVLSELVSLDAWHAPIVIDTSTLRVTVELSFTRARLGGNDTSFPFTFTVALRSAN